MIGAAAGLAKEGFIPFANTYASFCASRCADQVRVNMAYMKLPIKLIGLTAGYAAGILGATHISVEDIVVIAWPQGTACTKCSRIVQENLSRQLAKVLQPRILFARDTLDIGQSISLRALHIAYRIVVDAHIVHRNHIATALADGTAEKALGQWTLTKHAY